MARARLFLLGCCAVLACARVASAEQRADYMLAVQPAGTYLVLDYFGTGAQLTLERRERIYGAANDAIFGVSTLVGFPLAQVTTQASLRILFLELGGQLGYRTTWRNLTFEPGPNGEYCIACDRAARREQDPVLRAGPGSDAFGFAEGRLQLFAPMNEHVVFTSYFAARYEDSLPRAYDWFFASVHDGGLITRSETQLFFKHRDWGGIAPYVQVMFLPRAGRRETEVAYGFNAVRRLGLVKRDDLLFFTFLIRPTDPYYGQHAYFSPIRALLVYRLMLDL